MNNKIIGTIFDIRCKILQDNYMIYSICNNNTLRNRLKYRGLNTGIKSMQRKVFTSMKIPPMSQLETSNIKIRPYNNTINLI